jgi:hypothetical protein
MDVCVSLLWIARDGRGGREGVGCCKVGTDASRYHSPDPAPTLPAHTHPALHIINPSALHRCSGACHEMEPFCVLRGACVHWWLHMRGIAIAAVAPVMRWNHLVFCVVRACTGGYTCVVRVSGSSPTQHRLCVHNAAPAGGRLAGAPATHTTPVQVSSTAGPAGSTPLGGWYRDDHRGCRQWALWCVQPATSPPPPPPPPRPPLHCHVAAAVL